jgi:beta-aspartyl-dipeptidase (metallo-type)
MALTRDGVTVDVTAFPPDDDAPGAAQAIQEYLAAGCDPARLTVSSDGGGCLPVFGPDGHMTAMDVGRSHALAEALAELLAAGVAADVVVPMFTRNVARQFRLWRKGELLPGRDADLVVLGDDHLPLHVMARGRWLVRAAKACAVSLFERRN